MNNIVYFWLKPTKKLLKIVLNDVHNSINFKYIFYLKIYSLHGKVLLLLTAEKNKIALIYFVFFDNSLNN